MQTVITRKLLLFEDISSKGEGKILELVVSSCFLLTIGLGLYKCIVWIYRDGLDAMWSWMGGHRNNSRCRFVRGQKLNNDSSDGTTFVVEFDDNSDFEVLSGDYSNIVPSMTQQQRKQSSEEASQIVRVLSDFRVTLTEANFPNNNEDATTWPITESHENETKSVGTTTGSDCDLQDLEYGQKTIHFESTSHNNIQQQTDQQIMKQYIKLPDLATGPLPPKCPICLCGFKVGSSVVWSPECQHIFHAQCMETWMLTQPNKSQSNSCSTTTSRTKCLAANDEFEISSNSMEEVLWTLDVLDCDDTDSTDSSGLDR